MASQPSPPTPPPFNAELPRPVLQRTASTPSPPQVPSKDFLTSAHRTSSMGVLPLKKRPSGFTLSSPLAPIPPSLPSPASRLGHSPPPLPKKSSSRPSTASSREEVTPWEFQSGPLETVASPIDDNFERTLTPALQSKSPSIKSKPPSLKSTHQPSVRSRSSSTATGLVEDVTPWELYPPIPEKNTKYHLPTHTIPEQISPVSNPPPTTATGFVEDVTPWELVPPPSEAPMKSASRAPSHLTSVDETSTLHSFDSAGRDRAPPSPRSFSKQRSHVSVASSQEHKAPRTGPTEDVTPWELEPGPGPDSTLEDSDEIKQSASSRMRSSLTLAQVEEVTPWELHPAPSTPRATEGMTAETEGSIVNGGGVIRKKGSRSGNPFASSGNKALSDLPFVRGRRHGTRPSKSRHISGSYNSAKPRAQSPVEHLPIQTYDPSNDISDEIPPQDHSRAPEIPPTPRTATKSTTSFNGALPSPITPDLTKPAKTEAPTKPQFNLSTADRKILTQLEFFKDAHDKEFVLKGKGYHQQGGGVTPGKVHHAYDEKEAPYPRSYDPRAQDLDVWEIMICHQVCESWTWHVFETPPRTVLDIGCGTGSWITHAAGEWKDCHFWGIDLVPTQPDFNTLGDRDLKERVHWVHHNFLNGLPFEDEQFDYIHIKRVGLGVPENKWDTLFEECKRVLKSGGAFEMIEEDLFFPGKPNDGTEIPLNMLMISDGDLEPSSGQSSFTSNDSTLIQPTSPSVAIDTLDTNTPVSAHSTDPDMSPATPTTNQTSALATPPSEPSILIADSMKHVTFTDGGSGHDKHDKEPPSPPQSAIGTLNTLDLPVHVPPTTPHSRSTAKPTLYVKTPLAHGNSKFANSAVSLLNALGHHTPTSGGEYPGAVPRQRLSGMVASSNEDESHGMRNRRDSSHGVQSQTSAEGKSMQNDRRKRKPESYLLKQYKAPINPRDHTILEAIYTEMLSSRFINVAPLSILQNYLEYHFTDVRTHPPLLYTFPPTALLHSESRYVTDSETESESSNEFSSDDDEARDAIRPKPPKPKHSKSPLGSAELPRSRYRCMLGKPAEEAPDDVRILSFPHLLRRQSPYVSFDGSRGYAFSPAAHLQRRNSDGNSSGPIRMSRMPNPVLNIDLRTLNMHLYLRTMDILACSEPMWEWVMQYQADLAKRRTLNGIADRPIRHMQSDASLSSAASTGSADPVMGGIAEMTRDDFEILLANFELDMQDQASVDYALQEQVNWRVFPSPRDLRRKAFDEACKKWDKWVAKQERRARHLTSHHHHMKNGESTNGDTTIPEYRRHSNGNPLSPGLANGTIDNHGPSEANSGKQSSAKRDTSQPSPIPFSPSSLPPHKRLSRAIRVFVAWKPRDPDSPIQAVPTLSSFEPLDTPLTS